MQVKIKDLLNFSVADVGLKVRGSESSEKEVLKRLLVKNKTAR